MKDEMAMVVAGLCFILFLVIFIYRQVDETRRLKEAKRQKEKQRKEWEDDTPTKSSQNDTNRLLRQIESNTAKTAFWTKVVGVPVLIGIITWALVSMTKC